MSYETDLTTTIIPEKSTAILSFVVKDENGTPIAGTNLTTLTVTLYNKATGAIINNRDGTDILGVNGGSVDGSGNGEWLMEPADNQIVVTELKNEEHIALFTWTYAGGKTGRHRALLSVKDLLKVT